LTTKPPKKRQKGDSAVKKLTDAKILGEIAAGKTVGQIAKEMGLHRTTVSKVLNGEDAKAIIKDAQDALHTAVPKAVQVLINALDSPDEMTAVNVARDILKNIGALQTKVELDHKFPKPVVIERINGTTVVLGTMADVGEGKSDE
jgi:predicted transcriptional regulator